MQVKDLQLSDISLGDEASFRRTWTEADLDLFSTLSGNINPLHTDEEYAATTKFGKRIMYGMHVAILCSTLVGVYLPGKRCLCLRQDLQFKGPVYVDDTVITKGVVSKKSESTRILTIDITIVKESDASQVVCGTMTVQVL